MKPIKKNVNIYILIIAIVIIILNTILILKNNAIYQNKINATMGNIIEKIKDYYPDVKEEEIIAILNKKYISTGEGKQILEKYGINEKEIAIESLKKQKNNMILISDISIGLVSICICIIIYKYEKNKRKEIEKIIEYIENLNKKNYDLKIQENEEEWSSKLTNELYKITIMLREQTDLSIKEKHILQTSLEDISHQIKTPLTSISIMLDNIRENQNMDEGIRNQFLHEINRQIEWIKWLVISLLKLSKLDSDTVVFTKNEINVKELIEQVVKNLAIPLDIKQQNIIIQGKEAKFIGDYNWQLEAITNIIKNCIEHTEENKNIYISFEENNFYTKIVIRDEGTGIYPEDVKHIFERFYKGKNSSENSIGIGLALAKSIVEKDNGYITCSSELNKGTTFEIKYMKP